MEGNLLASSHKKIRGKGEADLTLLVCWELKKTDKPDTRTSRSHIWKGIG